MCCVFTNSLKFTGVVILKQILIYFELSKSIYIDIFWWCNRRTKNVQNSN